MYTEATGVRPMSRARLISPRFPEGTEDLQKCVIFKYNAYGNHLGLIYLRDQNYRFYYKVRPGAVEIFISDV